jgi:hypothetical protein
MSTADFLIETVQIKSSIELVNATSDDKFEALVERIVSKVHNSSESSFKADEFARLQKALNMSSDQVQLMTDFVEFVFLQAAYYMIKAAQLQEHLYKLHMDESKAAVIVNVWQREGKQIIDQIRTNKSISPNRLEGVKWRLSLNLASDAKQKLKAPNALFEFNVAKDEHETSFNKHESFQVEFSKDQLYDFFTNLENIQKRIDELTS